MGGKRRDERRDETPRTDLPAEREPYYDGYFGTDEEEGVEREREAGEADEGGEGGDAGDAGEAEEGEPEPVRPERGREAAEEAAGGDRGLI